MKKVYLHIGRHKTGTSSIQNFVVENLPLLKNHNILYPESGRVGVAHHAIADMCSYQRERQNDAIIDFENISIIKDLQSEIDNSDGDILISSEAFQNSNPTQIKKIFHKYDVQILVYLRNQIDYLASSYAQKVWATNYCKSMEEYFESNFNVDYFDFLMNWERSFPGKISVSLYDKNRLLENDVVVDFFANMLNKKDSTFLSVVQNRKTINSNPSLTRKLLSFKLKYNQSNSYSSLTEKEERIMRKALEQLSRVIDDRSVKITDNLVNQCKLRFSDTNKMVCDKYFRNELVFHKNIITSENTDIGHNELHSICDKLIEINSDLKNTLNSFKSEHPIRLAG